MEDSLGERRPRRVQLLTFKFYDMQTIKVNVKRENGNVLFLINSELDLNYNKARKIEKEIENYQYEVITRRMTAEAAKREAENMLKKIDNEYELGIEHLSNENQKNIREWIYGGAGQISEIINSNSKSYCKKNKKIKEKGHLHRQPNSGDKKNVLLSNTKITINYYITKKKGKKLCAIFL